MEVIADREISGNMIPFPVKYRKRDFFSIKYKKRLKAIPHKEAPTDESVGGSAAGRSPHKSSNLLRKFVIRHKNPPTDESVGVFAAGRSPHKSFKSSDKVCDTTQKSAHR